METTKPKPTRPSSLPALDQCPQFESDPIERDFAAAGTLRHEALSELLEIGPNDPTPLFDALEIEAQEAVTWAAEYVIMTKADAPLVLEKLIEIDTGNEILRGTPDVHDSTANVYDLKWRFRAYGPQLAAYALGIMDAEFLDSITVHILYGESMKAVKYSLTIEEARAEVLRVLAKVDSGAAASPCDYCGWCSKTATCKPFLDRANAILNGREDWALDSYHATELETPEGMAKALILAKLMADGIAAVEYHAKEMAVKNGGLPGFKLATRKGKPSFTDLAKVNQITSLGDDEFLKICKVSMTALKGAFVTANKNKYTTKAAAEKDLEKKLQQVILRAPDTLYLRKETQKPTPTQKAKK